MCKELSLKIVAIWSHDLFVHWLHYLNVFLIFYPQVLADIEVAQSMQKEKKKTAKVIMTMNWRPIQWLDVSEHWTNHDKSYICILEEKRHKGAWPASTK